MEHSVYVEAAHGAGQDRAVFRDVGTHVWLVVADGAGGSGSGADAADAVLRRAERELAVPRGAEEIRELLSAIDRELVRGGTGGETTAIVLSCRDGRVAGASVGDSEAELLRPNGSVVTLTAGQHRKPLIGSGAAVPVAFESAVDGATLVVATDGLYKYVDARARASVIASTDALDGRRVADHARLRSGNLPDDLAVVLVRLAQSATAQRLRILFAENDVVFARVVTQQFLGAHDVVVAPSIRAARSELAKGTFDAILCDYDLDDGKGDALVRAVRSSGFAGRIIAVSSHDAGNEALVRAGCNSACGKLRFDEIGRHLGVSASE